MRTSAVRIQPPPQREQSLAEVLTIGEIARIYGVTLRALRFYEQRGLLKPIRRGAARFYDSEQKARLQLILKGKHLGFTLTEIADLLDGDAHRARPADDFVLDEKMVLSQLRHLEERRAELDEAIEELRSTHGRLVAGAR
ncbi:MerR family transcriptional regulator [Rhodoblastus sp.]|jgi:DNA-binding transcriptional MerR regulator|uniref:MerR family transcriptional regulator n=1 Tax=Rhodoblastus sp. TaxID=1962975 RepID=UPI0026312271|nr:MerR family transcriptional regulator [Rhodoblastus sp.]